MEQRVIAITVVSDASENFSNIPVMCTKLDEKGRTTGVALIRGVMVAVVQSSKDWRKWQIIDEDYEELEQLETNHCVPPWGHEEDLGALVYSLKQSYHQLSMPVEHWRIPYATYSIKNVRLYKMHEDGNLILTSDNATVHFTHTDEKSMQHGYTVIGTALLRVVKTDEISWVF